MKRSFKRAALLLALLGLMWVLAGCGMDGTVEDLFTLPRIPDEYTGLNQQIEALLADGYEYAPPTVGLNIQAVQMEDLNGDDVQEAIIFFRKSSDAKPLKILVFEKTGETYGLLCTVESSGNSIDSVYYEDLTGDGRKELVVGWKISSTVQTVAVYNIGREAIPLMSSSYTRFVVQDLNSYDPHALFVMRSDSDGTPLAEVYTWQTNILAVAYRCGLSSTMADLARGSVVKGTLVGAKPAVFLTGVNDSSNAVTDILTWENSGAVVNLTMDETTGKSRLIQPYCQLIPQDVNDDGVTEVPFPDWWNNGNDALTTWQQFNRIGWSHKVAQTYHCRSGGWYFQLPERWWDRVTVETAEIMAGENQVTLYLDGEEALALYTITSENRESRASMGDRFILWRQPGTIYAAELYGAAARYGMDVQQVNDCFHMMVSAWLPSSD